MLEESSDKLYYTMGEVTKKLNVAPSLLRFWEKEFDEINPKKSIKGNRLYTKSDIELLKLIYHLTRQQGLTLNGVKERLKSKNPGGDKNMKLMESLQKVRQFLVELTFQRVVYKGLGIIMRIQHQRYIHIARYLLSEFQQVFLNLGLLVGRVIRLFKTQADKGFQIIKYVILNNLN